MTLSSPPLAAALVRCGDRCTRELIEELQAADEGLVEHGAGVANVAVTLGWRLGIGSERLITLCRAALLHDIGKRYVPREVLDKPGPLLTHERQLVEAHAGVGAAMLQQAGLRAEAAVVRNHHERWDGTGYPDRLHGDAIPLESRIIAVADTFDAMTSIRPYRPGVPLDDTLAELRRCSGAQFDPVCVGAFLEAYEAGAIELSPGGALAR